VRQARRLRLRLAHRPARLYQSLRRLSIAPEKEHSSLGEYQAPTVEPARRGGLETRAALFADLIPRHLDGPILRYTNRLRLLDLAGKLDLPPFQANLLIAAVQHHHKTPHPASARRWPWSVALFLAVQSSILLLAWMILA
jgi:hypothetical protein